MNKLVCALIIVAVMGGSALASPCYYTPPPAECVNRTNICWARDSPHPSMCWALPNGAACPSGSVFYDSCCAWLKQCSSTTYPTSGCGDSGASYVASTQACTSNKDGSPLPIACCLGQ